MKIFSRFGFEVVTQRGSHMKLRRVIAGINQTLTVPNHKSIDRGPTSAIYKQACRYIPELGFNKKIKHQLCDFFTRFHRHKKSAIFQYP